MPDSEQKSPYAFAGESVTNGEAWTGISAGAEGSTGSATVETLKDIGTAAVNYGSDAVNSAVDYGGAIAEAASEPFAGMYDGEPSLAAAGGQTPVSSFMEHYVAPAMHAAHYAVKHGSPASKLLGKVNPVIAGALAVDHLGDGIGSEGNERWDHFGSAAINAASIHPYAGAALGAVELGWNGSQALGGALLHGDSHYYQHCGGNMNQVLGYGMAKIAGDDKATSMFERRDEYDRELAARGGP